MTMEMTIDLEASRQFQDMFERDREDDGFWGERSKIDFAIGLNKMLKKHELARGDFARNLGTSPAYVTKLLSGDTNCTIETMVRAARASGGRLCLDVVPEHSEMVWLGVLRSNRQPAAGPSWLTELPPDAGRVHRRVSDGEETPAAA